MGALNPSLCACCITCINLFSPSFLASRFGREEGGGLATQGGSSDPRGCCITNIAASPLFVYFLPNPPARQPSAQPGWGKHRRKNCFHRLVQICPENKTFLHRGGKSLLPDSISVRASFRPWRLKCPRQCLASLQNPQNPPLLEGIHN